MKFFLRKIKRATKDAAGMFLGAQPDLAAIKLKEKRRLVWVEEALLDTPNQVLAKTDKNYLGLSLTPRDLMIFFWLILLGLFLLFGRALFLQVIRGDHYLALAEKNRIRLINQSAPRGIIYDRRGAALVKNVPDFAVFLVPADLQSNEEQKIKTLTWLEKFLPTDKIEERLSEILGITPQTKEYLEPILLTSGLDYQTAIAMRIERVHHPGVMVEVVARREYLNRFANEHYPSFSQILGYLGRINEVEYQELQSQGYLFSDYLGQMGVEKTQEKMLRGKYGKEQVEVDARGRAVKIIAKEAMKKGDNVYLTIDVEVQKKLEAIVRAQLVKQGVSGAAVIEEVQTGKLLALVSLPSFDNNVFARGISQTEFQNLTTNGAQPLFNRAISGEYPSGSTIKPVIAAAALAEGVITEKTTFLSSGGIKISDWFFPDWRSGGHGLTDVRKAIAESVNTFFYIIGGGFGQTKGLGVYKIKDYAEKFGLNANSGVALTNEKDGFIPTPEWKDKVKQERWYIGDTYHLAIGQGDLLVTPLQVANFTAALANGGKLFKPQIIDRYFEQAMNEFKSIAPEIVRQEFIGNDVLNIVRQGMRQAVTRGSAKILQALPVAAAAKTGTAQWKTGRPPHAWFTAFAPYQNPEIAVTVFIEEGGEGNGASAQVAFDFMNWYFRYLKK